MSWILILILVVNARICDVLMNGDGGDGGFAVEGGSCVLVVVESVVVVGGVEAVAVVGRCVVACMDLDGGIRLDMGKTSIRRGIFLCLHRENVYWVVVDMHPCLEFVDVLCLRKSKSFEGESWVERQGFSDEHLEE